MNDLIRRKDAIDSPVKMVSEGLEWIPVYHIKELPSAEPRKKGEWQWCGNHHLCSECDEWALTRWNEDECDEVDILTDFCPNCGADMRGTT